MKYYWYCLALLVLASCQKDVTAPPIHREDVQLTDEDPLLFGNPSLAIATTDSLNNYLLHQPTYALSYSRDRGTPNWVSWHLCAHDLGATPRQDNFRADISLPDGWYRVAASAYSGSGFDRGHNIPSADRTRTVEENSSTFLMTNMIPQAPQHNRRTWATLEDSLRRLVNAGFEVYVIMGVYGVGGSGSNGFAMTINGGRVTVPASVWKIAVLLPEGDKDLSRITERTRVIAVDAPNVNNVQANWKNYRVSVDEIENKTGYDLLNRLPENLQSVIEARSDSF